MAAKLLHSLADENPDLQKQIGCMTGIFHLFDRHHLITDRRICQRRLPSGNSHFSDGILERDPNGVRHQQTAANMRLNKSLNEKQIVSTESSRASFSSCSSSLSSLDCNQAAQPEAPLDRIIFPETLSRDPVISQTITSLQFGHQPLDLRDVVKDSMYREARGLSVKTTSKEEAVGYSTKRRDSPRPFQPSKSVDGSYEIEVNAKPSVAVDLKESLRVLAKDREAPWYSNETRGHPSSSNEVKGGAWKSISKDPPWFSYDGRDRRRLSFESRDTIKSMPKLKELPRLSLDGREVSVHSSSYDSKPTALSKGFHNGSNSTEKISHLPQSSGTQKRPPSVVAKLMGLEAFPSSSACDALTGLSKNSSAGDKETVSRSLKPNDVNRPIMIPNSPKNSLKDSTSPRRKNPDLVMRPIPNSRVPIEPAPWKQFDASQGSQEPSFRPVKVPEKIPDSFPSVYSEIEKRLKDLEIKQSGRDLRALKQILEAIQAKGLLETRKEEQTSDFCTQRNCDLKDMNLNQNSKTVREWRLQCNRVNFSHVRKSDSTKTLESPIVIMKPAKLIGKCGSPSSVFPIDGFSGSHILQSGGMVETKRCSGNVQIPEEQSHKCHGKSAPNSSVIKKSSRNGRSMHSVSKETTPSSVKGAGSVSPRLQQKKPELEKRFRPPTPPSDSNKPRRKFNNQATGSCSTGGKQRAKSPNLQQSDDQSSEMSNDSRTLSCQGDDISVQSDGNNILDSKMELEVASNLHLVRMNGSHSPSTKAANNLVSNSIERKSLALLDEDALVKQLAPEHPSPVSVLDAAIYRDDALSPVKQTMNSVDDDIAQEPSAHQNEDQWKHEDSCLSNSVESGLTSEINHKKLECVEHLVQKLRRLNSSHDEASTDYIALLCENTNPDHRYISEILLASGLLLRDLSSDLMPFQLHPSGHPINPELFFVLEQTKTSSLPPEQECSLGKIAHLKLNADKFHRKLIFDTVNELLGVKLALVGISPEPWLKRSRLAKKTLSAQKLLKELCLEIEQIQTKSSRSLEVEEDDPRNIPEEDVMPGSEGWTDFKSEMPWLVLDIERLVFKDLVDEIVIGEAAGSRAKFGRRRQLFMK